MCFLSGRFNTYVGPAFRGIVKSSRAFQIFRSLLPAQSRHEKQITNNNLLNQCPVTQPSIRDFCYYKVVFEKFTGHCVCVLTVWARYFMRTMATLYKEAFRNTTRVVFFTLLRLCCITKFRYAEIFFSFTRAAVPPQSLQSQQFKLYKWCNIATSLLKLKTRNS